MKHKLLKFTMSIAILSLLLAMQIRADDQDFFYEENSNQITFKYYDLEFISKAGGNVPFFQFLTDSNFAMETAFSFNVQFRSIIEYMDYNEDGVFQYEETGLWKYSSPQGPVYSNVLSLASMQWDFSGFRVDYNQITEEQQEVTTVHFDYTSIGTSAPNYNDFEIKITVHMYLANQTIDGYQIHGGAEMKFDVTMNNWPWQRDNTSLALRFDIIPTTNTHGINDTNGQLVNNYEVSTGNETKVQNRAQVKEQFTIGDEKYQAFFAYANQAKYKISNTYQYRDVNASYSSTGNGPVQTYLCFEHFDAEVLYDPSIGSLEGVTIPETEASGLGALEIVIISSVSVLGIALIVRELTKKK